MKLLFTIFGCVFCFYSTEIVLNLKVIADNSSKSKTVEKYYDESENVVCYYVDNAMSCIWSMEKFK